MKDDRSGHKMFPRHHYNGTSALSGGSTHFIYTINVIYPAAEKAHVAPCLQLSVCLPAYLSACLYFCAHEYLDSLKYLRVMDSASGYLL